MDINILKQIWDSMNFYNPKVLVVATSRKTRGGITSVVKSHEQGDHWAKYRCRWIETHIDKGKLNKLFFLIKSLIVFIVCIPFYQLVHIHFSEPVSAIRKSLYFRISKFFKKKIVLHLHAFSPETTLNGKYKKLYIKMLKNADAIIALSVFWENEILAILGESNKIHVIYNPCPVVRTEENIKEKTILFAGTLNKRKGYADLINAFGKIAQNHQDWRLLIAGSGEFEEAEQLIKKKKLSDQIILLGWVGGQKKDTLFKKASIFCLPSYAEGFPMAVLDAWAYGIPVVCTPVGGLPDVIRDGENALLHDYGNIDQLANQIELLINDDDLRNAIALKSKGLSNTIFDLQEINRQIGDLYKEVILCDNRKSN